MEIGKKYMDVRTNRRAVKVVRVIRDDITGTRRAEVVWAVNGSIPGWWHERYIWESQWQYYNER